MKKYKNILYFIFSLFITFSLCSCNVNNIKIINADMISLYEHKIYLVNDYEDEFYNSINNKEYDEKYFNDKSLIIIITQADSSSIKYSVTNLEINDNKCVVSIEGKSKDYVTMDLVSQYIFIELDKAIIVEM